MQREPQLNPIGWVVFLAVGLLGLAFGSFANVVIWRFPRGESLSHPGSHCPKCETPIAWYDNLPVLGWIILRGRCRSCGNGISARYPVVEALTAVLWLVALLVYGPTVRAIFAAGLFYLLMILSYIDFDTMRLPNALVAILAVLGVIGLGAAMLSGHAVVPLVDGSGRLANPLLFAALGVALGGLVPLAISIIYQLVRGSVGLGMGDVKLLAAIGIFLGPYVLLALFLGSVVGAVTSLATMGASSGLNKKIPFGPFLAVGAVVAALGGERVVAWYLSIL
jgi:leader peptidase (prepilin peptidase)/N-methyltransferase